MKELPLNQILCGDNREILPTLPEDSIDLVVTSPPYWGLRDYGGESQIWGGDPNCEHEWAITPPPRQRSESDIKDLNSKQATMRGTNYDSQPGNICIKCGAWRGSLGLEPHPQMFIDHLVEISREIKRVIKPSGSFWLNLGDTYYSGAGGRTKESVNDIEWVREGTTPKRNDKLRSNWLQPKQLLGIPWRVATALQDDGWILRNCVIWFKPNHMPESVKDRLTKSYEFFFFFVKQRKYYFDLDSIREKPSTGLDYVRKITTKKAGTQNYPNSGRGREFDDKGGFNMENNPLGKNPGDVLTKHEVATGRIGNFSYDDPLHKMAYHKNGKNPGDFWEIPTQPFPGSHFAVFPLDLIEPIIKSSSPKKGIVLDPFAGSGTALRVARKLGRKYIGIELNPEYAAMCERRVRADSYTPPPEGVPTLWEALEK